MITPEKIERLAHLLVGPGPGWQSRFGRLTGMSTGHVSNLLSGSRSITQIAVVRIIAAARREATALRVRADEVDAELKALPTFAEFRELPRGDDLDQGDDK
jgi:hypothetical protein